MEEVEGPPFKASSVLVWEGWCIFKVFFDRNKWNRMPSLQINRRGRKGGQGWWHNSTKGFWWVVVGFVDGCGWVADRSGVVRQAQRIY